MPTRKAPQPVDLDALVHNIAARVAATKGCTIASCKIPSSAKREVLERLQNEGLEITKSNIRQPIRDQVRVLLETGAFLPLSTLRTQLKGASATEAKKAALDLAAAGAARLVIRARKEWIVPTTTPVVARNRLPTTVKGIDAALKLAKSAAGKRNGATVLCDDLLAFLAPVVAELDTSPPVHPPENVLQVARRLTDPNLGLAFVPAVVAVLCEASSLADAHSAILQAEQRGEIELRPESGLGRLSDDERARCILGADGTLMSWLRLRIARSS